MKRTLMIAACVSLAGLATAQKGIPTTLFANGSGLTGAAANAGPVLISTTYDPVLGSTTDVIDISGTPSWDGALDPDNVILGIAAGSETIGLGWDVNLATVGLSWLSEPIMGFDGLINLTVGVGDDGPGTASYSSGGVIDLLGAVGFTIPNAGPMPVEFFEGYDDVPDAIDANFTAGSTLTVQYIGGAAGVPTVSQWGLIILTVMLLLGVVAMSLKSKEATA